MDTPNGEPHVFIPQLALRGCIGGLFMGLANLVPGISGGTMLVAAGVYPRFIAAIAELTTLKFRRQSLVVLAAVVLTAVVAVLAFARPVKDLVVEHRWAAYSVFIGLTLGGVPIVWKMIRRRSKEVFVGIVAGVVVMVLVAWWQTSQDAAASSDGIGWMEFFVAGLAGGSAMILPGISGGYLLLVLGVYVPILAAIADLKDGLRAGDWGAVLSLTSSVVLPVGIGVVVGIVLVSNLLKWLLARYEGATLGVLLGLLIGAVVGLWPFQAGVSPKQGDVFKGRVLDANALAQLKPEDYPTAFFDPTAMQVVGAVGLMIAGFAVTMLVAKLGREDE